MDIDETAATQTILARSAPTLLADPIGILPKKQTEEKPFGTGSKHEHDKEIPVRPSSNGDSQEVRLSPNESVKTYHVSSNDRWSDPSSIQARPHWMGAPTLEAIT